MTKTSIKSVLFITVISFCFSILPFAFAYSQTGVESDCETNMENIFKICEFKRKYETVQFIYKYRERRFFKNDGILNDCFKLIRGFPYFEEQKASTSGAKSGELVKVEFMSKEETDRYFEQLNYTPEEAYRDYSDYIRNIKLEKEIYLKCIEAELAKGDVSEYAKSNMEYFFMEPGSSLTSPEITKLDFLKIFKEFVLNGNEEVLPKEKPVCD